MSVAAVTAVVSEMAEARVHITHKPPGNMHLEHQALDSTVFADGKPPGDKCARLGKESEEGNVEYKRQLLDPSPERFEHLVSQLKYRLQEGLGEAVYEIGREDDGTPRGLSEVELEASLQTLGRMAKALNADSQVVSIKQGEKGKCAAVLIRKLAHDRYLDIRVAVAGNVDSGKSTLIGVLTRGVLDNGRGLARLNVFTHKHEIESGRTSSISQQVMGFDAHGNTITQQGPSKTLSWEEVLEQSAKTITFFDLAGHEKYLKTTVFGMTGHLPDYVMVMIGANMGITRITREHLGIAIALGVPIFCVVTKVDIAPEHVLKQTMEDLVSILKSPGARKLPYMVRSMDDVIVCTKNICSERMAPIFQVSSVTGHNLELIRSFVNLLPASDKWDELSKKPAEFRIDETFGVLGVGTVVAGTVVAGSIEPNATLLLGPDDAGHFAPVVVKSIHYKRVPVSCAVAGQTCSFALKKVKRSAIRKGMVMVDASLKPKAARMFQAEVLVLKHPTTIQPGYQPVIHCVTVRQTAAIVAMDKDILRTGDRSIATFRFLYRPEYLTVGTKLIFREGKTKGIGKISKLIFDEPHPELSQQPSAAVPVSTPGPTSHPDSNSNSNSNPAAHTKSQPHAQPSKKPDAKAEVKQHHSSHSQDGSKEKLASHDKFSHHTQAPLVDTKHAPVVKTQRTH